MANIPWETTHSVETNARPAFAWHYWTNIANWDDPPAEFELDGPFAAGSRGVTRLPGQEPLHWLIREVTPPNAATIEMSLDGAALLFEWRFVRLSDGRTRLTRRSLHLRNVNVGLFTLQNNPLANLADGMNKLATAMANADPNRKSPD